MKFDRKQLRAMILKEMKNLTESDLERRLRQGMGDAAYERFQDAQDPRLARYREAYQVVSGVDPNSGAPFSIEVDANQAYGMAALSGDYTNPNFEKRIPKAAAIYPQTYTLSMAIDDENKQNLYNF